MKQQVDISYEQMRSLVIHVLAQPTSSPLQLNDLWGSVGAAVVERHGVTPDKEGRSGIIQLMYGGGVRLTEPDCARVTSIIWDLIIEGVVGAPSLPAGLRTRRRGWSKLHGLLRCVARGCAMTSRYTTKGTRRLESACFRARRTRTSRSRRKSR